MRLIETLQSFLVRTLTLDRRVRALREELDALRCSLDVPRELEREYEAWRAARPALPAEPLVSVCIATYNRAQLLIERSVRSVLAQDYPRFEVVVVGDACTDDTERAVTALNDPRVRFENLRARGAYPENPHRRWMVAGSQAMNRGLELARGDLITHLDDDDEHLPGRISALVRHVQEHDADLVWHPFYYQRPSGGWLLNTAPYFGFEQVTTSSIFYRAWFKRIQWSLDAWRTNEPGDWHRLRRMRYLGIRALRFPEPLLRHYRERSQGA